VAAVPSLLKPSLLDESLLALSLPAVLLLVVSLLTVSAAAGTVLAPTPTPSNSATTATARRQLIDCITYLSFAYRPLCPEILLCATELAPSETSASPIGLTGSTGSHKPTDWQLAAWHQLADG
jgi:hypothetical protein